MAPRGTDTPRQHGGFSATRRGCRQSHSFAFDAREKRSSPSPGGKASHRSNAVPAEAKGGPLTKRALAQQPRLPVPSELSCWDYTVQDGRPPLSVQYHLVSCFAGRFLGGAKHRVNLLGLDWQSPYLSVPTRGFTFIDLRISKKHVLKKGYRVPGAMGSAVHPLPSHSSTCRHQAPGSRVKVA